MINKTVSLAIATSLKEQEENWPLLTELFLSDAKKRKARFDAFVDAGFNETQALFLVRE